uniref:Ankyrin repeat domain-containing protein 49 n=1 Tax=Acrobeloides nanus TaxID=290746 RepID=A0A914CQ29_9BILA
MSNSTDHNLNASTSNEVNDMEIDDNVKIAVETIDDVDAIIEEDEVDILLEQIRDQKKTNPGMFVSGWEVDEDGIIERDMTDPKEQILSAAEEGDLDRLKALLLNRPDLLQIRDHDGYTPLHRAAYNNHADVCRYLLSIGADPEARTENGWTVLHSAACWANYEIVGVLLSHGVDVNSRSEGGLTPLHLAINSSEDVEKQRITVKYLLDAPGVDMAAVTGAGDTPLMLARRASPQALELLEYYLKRP